MKMNIEELETADYDILENIKVAFYRLWKMKIVVLLMTLIGFLAFGVYVVTVQQAACRSTALLQMNSEAWWQMVISVLVGPAQIQRLMERN